jgi:hypothetical protein
MKNWRIIICWIFGREFDRRYPDCYRCGKLR